MQSYPAYLDVPSEELGDGHSVAITIVDDAEALAKQMAADILDAITASIWERGRSVLILPVGPVDQFPILADLVNEQEVSLDDVTIINMDEYLTDQGDWIPKDHPLSFRGFMDRMFYDRVHPEWAPPESQRVFPNPNRLDQIPELIDELGGIDACFGGIGINGHMAFNEPPEPGDNITDDEFRQLPTRTLPLSRETRTINANTVGGSIDVIPHQCVTVGMKEILGAKQVRFYCNRPWQSAVVRKVLHGPVAAACPASFLRTHDDAKLTVTKLVASRPEIHLR